MNDRGDAVILEITDICEFNFLLENFWRQRLQSSPPTVGIFSPLKQNFLDRKTCEFISRVPRLVA